VPGGVKIGCDRENLKVEGGFPVWRCDTMNRHVAIAPSAMTAPFTPSFIRKRSHLMSKIRTAFTALFVLVLCSAAAVAQYNSLRTVLPTKRMLAPHGLERAWWNQATINPSRDVIRHLVADEHVVIVQSRSGVVTVFDAENGKKLWAVRVGRVDAVSFPAVTNDDLMLIVTGTQLFALTKFDGNMIWRIRLPSTPSTSPEIDDDQVYFGARDGSVYAFDLRKIRQFYEEGLLPQWSAQTRAWRYKAFKEVTTPPISTGRVINFASKGRSLYSVTKTDRKLVWQFETDSQISAPMTQSNGSLFLPSEDFKLYCLNIENGRTRWVYNTGLPIRKPPTAIGNNVFLTPANGGLHVITPQTAKKWEVVIANTLAAGEQIEISVNGNPFTTMVTDETGPPDIADLLAKTINTDNLEGVSVDASTGNGVMIITTGPAADVSAKVTKNGNPVEGKVGIRSYVRYAGSRLWWKARITDFVAASPTRVYATDRFGSLIILAREDGATIASLPLRAFSVRIANGRTDRIFIAKPSGLVACIRESDIEYPLYYKFPDRRPILPELAPNPPTGKQATP